MLVDDLRREPSHRGRRKFLVTVDTLLHVASQANGELFHHITRETSGRNQGKDMQSKPNQSSDAEYSADFVEWLETEWSKLGCPYRFAYKYSGLSSVGHTGGLSTLLGGA
jgi:hypothetical protein